MPDPTYSPCFYCKDGMDIDPYSKKQDVPCPVCQGRQIIAEKCICGRPADMTKDGYVRLGRYCCGLAACRELTEKDLAPMSKYAKDEDARYSEWFKRGWMGDYCC